MERSRNESRRISPNIWIDSLSGDVKERLERDLGARVAELVRKVDSLTSGLDVCNELWVKCVKRTRKMLDIL